MRTSIVTLVLCCITASAAGAPDAPNFLWLTSEDNGPHLGAYGDGFADTPNLDELAARGVAYRTAWSNAPVCAPARTAIITGLYPTSTGAQHMRSKTRLPAGMKMFPQYLREAGYYCTNNAKEDYNLEKPGKVWDESSPEAHWRNRSDGQPFFAVFNIGVTHESFIRRRPQTPVHPSDGVRVPAYHPDTPEVRRDWAQYYDKMTEMDTAVGERLKELAEAGLDDDTIVFYYGDHGPGMPRGKRWPYESGLRVPLIVHIPEKWQPLASSDYLPGAMSERLVSFVDFAPTMLSLAGIRPPTHFQGHAFMGDYEAPPQPYLFGFRDRMDERYDMVRSVRDVRYLYVRNYMPHRIYGQHVAYMFETPTTRVWKELYDRGELEPPRTFFWETKPTEELYDLSADPDEVQNLADSPEHAQVLVRLRRAQQSHAVTTRDLGFLPEEEIHARSEGSTPLQMDYPMERAMAIAELAAGFDDDAVPALSEALEDSDSAVRFWAAQGLLARGRADTLTARLDDASPSVRAIAAEALGRFGDDRQRTAALETLLELASLDRYNIYVVMLALNALDVMDADAASALEAIRGLPRSHSSVMSSMENNVPKLLDKILADLEE